MKLQKIFSYNLYYKINFSILNFIYLVWMEGEESQKKKKRSRAKKIIWFNPPHSVNVKTNVGKHFLELLDKHFPVGDPLHRILNRNTVKISYRCLPNMGRRLSNHNAKVLKNVSSPVQKTPAGCNCQKSKRDNCPMPNACNQDGAVYETKVATSDGRVESYVGLAKNFKKRWRKHKTNLADRDSEGQTTMSRYVWRKRDEGLAPTVSWSYLEKNIPDFNPIWNM